MSEQAVRRRAATKTLSAPVPSETTSAVLDETTGELLNDTTTATGENDSMVAGEAMQDDGVRKLDMLLARGFNKQDIQKLKTGNIYCIEQLTSLPRKELCKIKGISEQKAERLQKEAFVICEDSASFTTALVVHQQRAELVMVHTGSKTLDCALGGGIETGSITEIYGEFRTGKSQLCHQLCVTCQLPIGGGGAAARAIYIDTEGTFRSERLTAISRRYGMNPELVLNNVCYAQARSSDHQIELISLIPSLIFGSRFGLVVVDSIMALLRSEYLGRGELAERQQKLNKMLRMLARIATEFGVAVVVTNQVSAQVDNPMAAMAGEGKKAIGGHIIAHASHTRLSLHKGRGTERTCKVVQSPCLPENNAKFSILPHGIDEVQEVERDGCGDDD